MFYAFLRFMANLVLMPIFFIRVIGKENLKIPTAGSVIISHHISNWDAIILGFIVKHKPVCFLAKEELYQSKVSRFFLRHLHTISIARGKGDLAAIKTALAALKEGKMLGIFPEGTRSTDGSILPFNQGTALMAIRADVPVIPVYIKGGYKLFRPIRVYVDPPINLKAIAGEKSSSQSLANATEYLRNKIVEMSERP